MENDSFKKKNDSFKKERAGLKAKLKGLRDAVTVIVNSCGDEAG